MGSKKRNMAIELMRCIMMFEIVFLHIMTQNGWFEQGGLFARHLLNLLLTGVEGFVFISGYYGIRFSVAKVARLVALFVFYTLVFVVPGWNWRYVFSHKLIHDWFLFAYLVLMAFAPAFNASLEGRSKWQLLSIALPIIVAVYGWSYLSVIPVVKEHVPVVTGFAPLSFFTMFGIYMAARVFRLLELDQKLTPGVLLLSGGVAVLFVVVGFHHHNSPFSFIWIACLFTVFSRIKLSACISKVVGWVAPTTFGIYLLHCTITGRWLRQMVIDLSAPHCGVYAGYLITTVVIFVACCLVDKMRTGIVAWFRVKR